MKRVTSIFLTLCLILSMMSTAVITAAAQDTEASAERAGAVTVAERQWYTPQQDAVPRAEDLRPLLPGGTASPDALWGAGNNLNVSEASIYAMLAEQIQQVAAGTRESTVFEMDAEDIFPVCTAADLGVESVYDSSTWRINTEARSAYEEMTDYDLGRIIDALLADLPYDLFWYDKTRGTSLGGCGISAWFDESRGEYVIGYVGTMEASFPVAREYASDSYQVNTEMMAAASSAGAKAREIVAAYAGRSDREKLYGYCREICALTSYNDDAAAGGAAYGNPWQLIWIFDGDETTKVVCEGYSKAFQFLCDLTSFQSSAVRCITVTGWSGGPHMWNVVTLEDGKNYLADVTNSDDGTIGQDMSLFLASPSGGSLGEGYSFDCDGYTMSYEYDDDMSSIYTVSELTLGDAAEPGPATEVFSQRMWGQTRTETAVAIAQAAFPYGSDSVILASGDNYPDALAGGPLAYALDAPILLVCRSRPDQATLDEIDRLGARNVFILGGTGVISEAVENTMRGKGLNVERIAGRTRFETAVAVAEKLDDLIGYKPDAVIFAFANNYPDALSISNVAAMGGVPILYIGSSGVLDDATRAYMDSCGGVEVSIILGGPLLIKERAEEQLEPYGEVARLYGHDRYETCIIINEVFDYMFDGDALCLACGTNYPDALAGSVFAAKAGAPMLLAGKSLTNDQVSYVKELHPAAVYAFGGTGALSDKVLEAVLKAAR